MPFVESILHPSDFSEASEVAFAHALRLALACKAELRLMHAQPGASEIAWQDFPAVRATLERWGRLPAGSPRRAVLNDLGVLVKKVGATHETSPTEAILGYLRRREADLIVLATQGRDGLPRWLHRSVAEPVARRSEASTLFVPAGVDGFVSLADGALALERVLVPVDRDPDPSAALAATAALAASLGASVTATLLHVGQPDTAPALEPPARDGVTWEFEARAGPVVDAILDRARDGGADLVLMATAGHEGFLDALRGSTSERVLRRAPCPVWTVPVRASGPKR